MLVLQLKLKQSEIFWNYYYSRLFASPLLWISEIVNHACHIWDYKIICFQPFYQPLSFSQQIITKTLMFLQYSIRERDLSAIMTCFMTEEIKAGKLKIVYSNFYLFISG